MCVAEIRCLNNIKEGGQRNSTQCLYYVLGTFDGMIAVDGSHRLIVAAAASTYAFRQH